jgi:putative photosynthetic complex assembly protein 2
MWPLDYLLPVIYTVFLWWFTTGLIMAAYGRSPAVLRGFFACATVVLALAFVGLLLTRDNHAPREVYIAATCGVLMWAWQLAGHYLGFITGPPTPTPTVRVNGLMRRFRLALRFSLYHELLALVTGFVIGALVWSSVNRWALWMYLALYLMHVSAKLNVFLGVRNFRVDLLPREMHHLGKLLAHRPSNELFPVSILLATGATLVLIYQAILPGTGAAQSTGSLLVATMLVLGLFEHWLMVLPLPETVRGWTPRLIPEPVESGAQMSCQTDSRKQSVSDKTTVEG